MAKMKPEMPESFGPNEAREFLRRNRLPMVPADDLTPKICAALLKLSHKVTELGSEITNLRGVVARMKREQEQITASHERTQTELVEAEHQLMEQSHLIQTDALTGVGNRHGFNMEMARMIARRKQAADGGERRTKNNPFPNAVVVMFDLNDFSDINAHHSHACGDEALKHVAEILKVNFRKGDYVARTGGDEFVAILYNSSLHAAEKTAEKIRDQVLRSDFVYGMPSPSLDGQQDFFRPASPAQSMKRKIPLSIAFGVHEVTKDDTPESIMEVVSLEMLSRKADSKTYADKFRVREDRLTRRQGDDTFRE